jgi:acetoin utilization deacetylase AcuC-like enzyme
MTNDEYAAAFTHLVLPVVYNFKPDLILIACGFDAAKGDLIGDCGLTPDMYYSMTRSLLEASPKTPFVVALEGGYNVELSALCMEKVALALLDESPSLENRDDRIVWTSAVSFFWMQRQYIVLLKCSPAQHTSISPHKSPFCHSALPF